MAIIYTYPQINSSSDLAASDLMIISDMSANGRPTKSLTLKNLADFVTSTGTGTGTTNKIIKWSDGPAGLLGDSIMTESATQIDLAGTFLSTSSPTGTSGPIHGIRANQTSTATGAFNIALYGDSKHTGANKGSYNYGLYTKAEFEGTNGYDGVLYGAYTEARYDGSGTNATWSSLYGAQAKARVTGTATGDLGYMIGNNISSVMDTGTAVDVEFLQGQHTNVTFNSGNVSGSIAVNLLDFDYPGGGTLQGDFAYLQIQNDPVPTPVAGTARAINSDSTLPSHFSGVVEIPLVPTANAHATSKQYVDQQIASIPAGLVFQGNWNANTNTPTLASGTGTVGNYYVVSVAGNTNLDGITDWEVGDWAVFVEVGGVDKWDKIDQTFVQGAGATGQVSFWNGVNSVTGDNDLYWDNSNKRLGIGTTSPGVKLDVFGSDGIRITTNSGALAAGYFAQLHSDYGSNALRLKSRAGDVFRATDFGQAVSILTGSTSSGTSERIRITSSGNVGIGTTTPSVDLEIGTSGSADTEFLMQSDQAGKYFKVSSSGNFTELKSVGDQNLFLNSSGAGGYLSFLAGNSERMRVNYNGNVGIGTTSPDRKLEVESTGTGEMCITGATGSRLYFRPTTSYSPGGNFGILVTGSGGPSYLSTMEITGYNNGVNTVMTLKGDGNVGIGTSSPSQKLHIAQDGNASIQLERTTAVGNPGSSRITVANNGQLGISSDNLITFKTSGASGGTERMRIANAGNVGIGTTSPAYKLDVSGSLRATDESTFTNNLLFPDNSRIKLGTGEDLQIYHNGTNSFIDNSVGNLYITNYSDNEDIIFRSDDGSGGVTEYFRLDGSLATGSRIYTVFPDNSTAVFGSGFDFQIHHDASNTYLQQGGTGDLYFQQNVDNRDIIFQCDNGSGGIIEYLRLDGSDERLTVNAPNGMLFFDNIKAKFGTASDLQIYHDGSNSYIQDASGTGDIRIASNIVHLNNAASTEVMLKAIENGAVELYHNDNKKLETTSTGTKTTGQMDLAALNTAVTNSDDNGNVGEIRFTSDYIYVCVADDTWKRVALSTW